MSTTVFSQKRFIGGIADYLKESANGQIANAYYFGRAIDYRSDPQSITLLPGAVNESGSVVTDLIKWGELVPTTLTSYFYGNTGNMYARTSAGSWSKLSTISGSHGNGLSYFTGDDYLYYTQDSTFGRYGPIQGTPQFADNYLGSLGGVPTNTYSVTMASASSQYAHAADSASLSITGDLTLEAYFKSTTLPSVGSAQTILGKWDENASHASYKLDLYGVSGFFGDGSDGALTISSDTTEAPIDSACTGTAGTQTLSATNASFAINQVVLIIQMTSAGGATAGQWERNVIQGYTAGTITLATPLVGTYTTGAQVRVVKQYTTVTINSTKTYTAKAWNGTVGGVLAWLASTLTTGAGNISGNYKGFQGNTNTSGNGEQGQGTDSNGTGNLTTGNGGGGGQSEGGSFYTGAGGGGGGNAAAGTAGGFTSSGGLNHVPGEGGLMAGAADLTTAVMGGAGGTGGCDTRTSSSTASGAGGAFIFITSADWTVTGTTSVSGQTATAGSGGDTGGSGGGAGGSILLKCQTATLGSGLLTATGGSGSVGAGSGASGGAGANGRIVLNYLTSYTGTTSPTLNAIQDNTLVTTTTTQARLGISNNGTSIEYLTQNLSALTTGVWNRLSVSWDASASMATFYVNGVQIGTSTGTKTAIDNNASLLYLAAEKGSSAVDNFFNGLLDDVRIWNNIQTETQIFANLNTQVNVASAGLVAYYKLNNSYSDATANANNLTAVNTPVFTTNVPFPGYTTRNDIDTQNTNIGDTYTLLTAISEASVDTLSFTPVTDPQSSVGFYVDTKGTGNWTVTIHDQQNNVIATSTIANANIPSSGFIEFFFSPQWRILAGYQYHMHLTVSTGTSKVVSGTANDFSDAEYATYFGYLVTDTQFHPIIQFQYQPLGGTLTGAEIIGNERYLAVWDGTNYEPNFITFPPGWHVRSFALWREFLAVGVWRGGNIYDFPNGRVYFWDGVAPAFNFYIDVPDGPINAMFGINTDLYMFAGSRGELLCYQGGYVSNVGNTQSSKIKRMPLLAAGDYTEVYPGAMTMWRGLLHFGLFGSSNSTTMQRGVYSYGTINQYYPNTLSYDYIPSTGNTGNTVTIGCVYPVGQSLIVGWQDGIAYGADKINFSNAPASSGELQVLVQDDGTIWKDKESLKVRADHLPLATGESVATEYNINRTGWIINTANSTSDSIFTADTIVTGRGNEYQIGFYLYATGSTSPTVTGISLLRDNLASETQF